MRPPTFEMAILKTARPAVAQKRERLQPKRRERRKAAEQPNQDNRAHRWTDKGNGQTSNKKVNQPESNQLNSLRACRLERFRRIFLRSNLRANTASKFRQHTPADKN